MTKGVITDFVDTTVSRLINTIEFWGSRIFGAIYASDLPRPSKRLLALTIAIPWVPFVGFFALTAIGAYGISVMIQLLYDVLRITYKEIMGS